MKIGALLCLLSLSACQYTAQEWREINAALDDLNRSTSHLADQMPYRQSLQTRPLVQDDHERRLQELEYQRHQLNNGLVCYVPPC